MQPESSLDELPDEPLAENVVADMARLAAGTPVRLLEIWVRRLCRSHELLRAKLSITATPAGEGE